MTPVRNVLVAAVAMCAIALGGMSVAWACTPAGGITADPGSGVPGSPVDISGTGFIAAGELHQEQEVGLVEIRWNTTSGPVLATATGPNFSQSVTVPQNAANRTYYFVAVQRRADGAAVRQAAAAFQVTGAKQDPAPPAEGTQQQPPAQPAAPPAGEAAAPEEPAPAPAVAGSSTAPAPTPAPVASRRPAREADAAAAAAPAATRQSESAVSLAPPIDPGLPGEAAAPPPAPPAVAEPSPLSVSGDIAAAWESGFSGARGPSLTTPVASAPARAPGLALALLGLGTAGLFAGALVGLRSRRRVLAGRAS